MSIKKTFLNGETLPASDLNTYLQNQGTEPIATQTFSGVSSVTFQNCFSATYRSYIIVLDGFNQTASGSGVYMRLGNTTGGTYTANSSGQYGYRGILVTGSLAVYNADTATSWIIGTTQSGNRIGSMIQLQSPFITPSQSTMQTKWQETYNGAGFNINASINNDASYNSFNIFVNSGTILGTVKVYGLV